MRELRVGEVSGDVEHAVEVLALVDLAAVVRVDGAEPRPGLLLGHGLAHAGGNLQRLDHVDAAAAVLVDGVEHHGEGVASVEGSPDGHNARLDFSSVGRADRGDAPVGIRCAANDPEGIEEADRYSARKGERSPATRVGCDARRTLYAVAWRHHTNVFFFPRDDPKRARAVDDFEKSFAWC